MSEIVDGVLSEEVLDLAEKTVKTGAQLVIGGTIEDIFTIIGGPILVTALVGEFTTAVTSGSSSTMQLKTDPTDGAATVMCTAVNLQNVIVNTWAYLTGAIGDPVVYAEPATALPLGIDADTFLIVPPGGIDMVMNNNTPTVGAITWYMRYKPLSHGITVIGAS